VHSANYMQLDAVKEMAQKTVEDWILSTPCSNPHFGFWCVVGAVYSTGLCPKCVFDDSSLNYGKCVNPDCKNASEYELH